MTQGNITDYGDVIRVEQWLIKGRRLELAWHIGAPRDTTPADRVPAPPSPRTGKADVLMDLLADKMVVISPSFKDEMGNPTAPPASYAASYSIDDASIITLTNNGDGTATAAATGVLGSATMHGVISFNGQTLSGDLLINVVAGLAERVEFVAGEPTEVTPDA